MSPKLASACWYHHCNTTSSPSHYHWASSFFYFGQSNEIQHTKLNCYYFHSIYFTISWAILLFKCYHPLLFLYKMFIHDSSPSSYWLIRVLCIWKNLINLLLRAIIKNIKKYFFQLCYHLDFVWSKVFM